MQFTTAFDIPAIKGSKSYISAHGPIAAARIAYGGGQVVFLGTAMDAGDEPLDRVFIAFVFSAENRAKLASSVDTLYLSDAQEEKAFPAGAPPLFHGTATVGKRDYPHSLAVRTHPQSASGATYNLEGKYTRAHGYVGLRDDAKNGPPLRFTIKGDGRVIWQSKPVTKDQPPQQFLIDIPGVRHLELSIEGSNDIRESEGVWMDPSVFVQGG